MTSDPAPRRRDDRGNTLLLMPVAVLIVFILGALAVDAAAQFGAQRRIQDIAAGIANDAAQALDEAALFQQDQVRIDPARAAQVVAQVSALYSSGQPGLECVLRDSGAVDRVTVRCTGQARSIFQATNALGLTSRQVSATASARAVAP